MLKRLISDLQQSNRVLNEECQKQRKYLLHMKRQTEQAEKNKQLKIGKIKQLQQQLAAITKQKKDITDQLQSRKKNQSDSFITQTRQLQNSVKQIRQKLQQKKKKLTVLREEKSSFQQIQNLAETKVLRSKNVEITPASLLEELTRSNEAIKTVLKLQTLNA